MQQVQVRAVEKTAVRDAHSRAPVRDPWLPVAPRENESVCRCRSSALYAMAMLAQHAPVVVPTAQAMQDHDLVPESALGIDGDYVRHDEIGRRHVIGDVGFNGGGTVRIQGRLGSGFDLDRWLHVFVGTGADRGITHQQSLLIRVVGIEDYRDFRERDTRLAECCIDLPVQTRLECPLDVSLWIVAVAVALADATVAELRCHSIWSIREEPRPRMLQHRERDTAPGHLA